METTHEQSTGDTKASFEALTDFRDRVPEYLEGILAQQLIDKTILQSDSFYLNSSDSLAALTKIDPKGKKVLSVSGSGEFAHVFINGGASAIDCFDISPAAGYFTELRHTALCNLDFEEYIKLFGSWARETGDDQILDRSVYDKLKRHLPQGTGFYFDSLFQESKLTSLLDANRFSGFARIRVNTRRGYNRLVGDIITHKNDYAILQNKAREVEFSQFICNATSMESLVNFCHPNIIYLSNIGYDLDKTIAIAKKYLGGDTPEVLCTASIYNSEFDNDDYDARHPDGRGPSYHDQKLKEGSIFTYTPLDSKPGEQSTKIEVVSIDRRVGYGLLLKLHK